MLLSKILCFTEFFHILSHGKVLLSFGKQYTTTEYRQKRIYFVFDALSVVTAFFFTNMTVKLFFLTFLHFLLHLFYILKWNDVNSFFVNSIIEWSAETNHEERRIKHGSPMYLYNTLGTLFDIFVHICMLYGIITST